MEGEAFGVEAAGDEGAERGVGSGDGVDGDAGGDGFGGDGGAGVGDAGHAGVGDDGDAAAGFEGFDELAGAGVFVVRVVADGGRADAEVVEQLGGLAGVFAGDAVDGAKDAEGAEGDVFEVADGGGDEVEAGGEGTVVRDGSAWVERRLRRAGAASITGVLAELGGGGAHEFDLLHGAGESSAA